MTVHCPLDHRATRYSVPASFATDSPVNLMGTSTRACSIIGNVLRTDWHVSQKTCTLEILLRYLRNEWGRKSKRSSANASFSYSNRDSSMYIVSPSVFFFVFFYLRTPELFREARNTETIFHDRVAAFILKTSFHPSQISMTLKH